ncbi:unnamed protein product [Amoebophrya sp. A120]|nr:unnamed protein product [Amoebophrya sp. A120]|eukprot:GSA120T00025223001.1
MYKFKEIQTVPPADAMIDIILSKTNRKTPTVVHPGYKISRIRNFYLRKIKFCQSAYAEKFQDMLSQFPRLDDIHPFYADLCNVLYDRDHYKLALGQISTTKNIIDNCAKDYVRMMKFADSLYRCKMLKRAALGRMCTAVKKLGPSLKYLEEVRQHLSRLPSINPTTRTLILTGFPNVGKSSFMNTVTNANVDVQPYAFTTKSLFLGHMDYRYTRWQVIDTPGILDHALEERNTIEMQAVTALAHIPATILYFMDISETCGRNLREQVNLFNSLKPLFRGKPLLIIVNKIDLRKMDDLQPEEKALLESMTKDMENEVTLFPVSVQQKEGVDAVRTKACDLLLSRRIDSKINSSKVDAIKNRIFIAEPTNPSIASKRPPCIPESVVLQQQQQASASSSSSSAGTTQATSAEGTKRVLEKDLQEEHGGAGVYVADWNKEWQLSNSNWKYDEIPEIMDGMNVADFIDTNILEKLAKLEEEERAELLAEGLEDTEQVLKSWQDCEKEIGLMHRAIKAKQNANRDRKARNAMGTGGIERKRNKSLKEVVERLEKRTIGEEKPVNVEKLRGRSKVRKRLNRDEEETGGKKRKADDGTAMDVDNDKKSAKRTSKSLMRSRTAGRSKSVKVRGLSVHTDRSQSRIATSIGRPELQEKAEKEKRKAGKVRNKEARKGEGDRHIPDFKPKHLFTGKRSIGKTDRR